MHYNDEGKEDENDNNIEAGDYDDGDSIVVLYDSPVVRASMLQLNRFQLKVLNTVT